MVCIRCHNYMGPLLAYYTTRPTRTKSEQKKKDHKSGQIAGRTSPMETEATNVTGMKNRPRMIMLIIPGAISQRSIKRNQNAD